MTADERFFYCHWCGQPQTVILKGDPTGETRGTFPCTSCGKDVLILVWNDKTVATSKRN